MMRGVAFLLLAALDKSWKLQKGHCYLMGDNMTVEKVMSVIRAECREERMGNAAKANAAKYNNNNRPEVLS